MVFRRAPDITTVNGKPVEPVKRYGKHIQLTTEQIELRANAMNAAEGIEAIDLPEPKGRSDVFASHGALSTFDVFERQRIVHDQGGFVDKWLGEMAVIAKDREWLRGQISDPRWVDHPARPDAIKQYDEMASKIADIADSIAWAEAWADRCWQTLTPSEREPVAMMWLTQPVVDRLVGRAWKDQAQFGWTWPEGFRVEAQWFVKLPAELYADLDHLWMDGVTWLGTPVEIDRSETERVNEELTRQIKSRLN